MIYTLYNNFPRLTQTRSTMKAQIKLKGSKAVVDCTVQEHLVRRPLRKAGSRLGSWTNDFYKLMSLVSFTTLEGKHHTQWVLSKRLTHCH